MSKTKQIAGVFLILGMILVLACAPQVASTPVPAAPTPAAASAPAPVKKAAPVAPARAAWEEEWEKTVAAARLEGKVVLHTSGSNLMRSAMITGFKDALGMTAEVMSGRTSELLPRLFAERRAGLYTLDLNVGGFSSILTLAKPAGILASLDSAPILPEVTDPKQWYRGQFPWVDKDHTVIRVSLHPNVPMAVNSSLVKEGEIKSWRDLLDPKWKGKLVFNDPTIPGAGQQGFQGLEALMGQDYLKELVKQEPVVMRDQRLQLDWLAQSKVAVVIVPTPEMLIEFLKAGAPIKVVVPQEGAWLSSGDGGITWFNNAPHINTAKVFINWLMSKRGQEVFAPAAWHQSLRVDVSTAHLPPWRIRDENVKYFDANTEEATVRAGGVATTARNLLGPLMK